MNEIITFERVEAMIIKAYALGFDCGFQESREGYNFEFPFKNNEEALFSDKEFREKTIKSIYAFIKDVMDNPELAEQYVKAQGGTNHA